MASESHPFATSLNSDSDSELGLNFQGRIRFSKIYDVEDKLDHLYQDTLPLSAYYTRLTTLWDELKSVEDSPSCTCGKCSCKCSDRWLQLYERRNTIRFLMRLNDSYSQVRKHITMMNPLPDFNTLYRLISQAEEEKQHSFPSSAPRGVLVLPPGCKFTPTDEDLFQHYLIPYMQGLISSFDVPIHLVDIYKSSPNELSEEFEKANNKEWFFISGRIKVGKGGKRMNRSVKGGYWRVTVSPKKINAGQGLVGYKSSLEYFVGKQPNGVKGDWLMHEYWLESSVDDDNNNERANLALCKIYLSPQAAKKKKAQEEEIEKQKKYEDDALVGFVEAALEEEVEEQPQFMHAPHPPILDQIGQFNPPHEAVLEEDYSCENPDRLSQPIEKQKNYEDDLVGFVEAALEEVEPILDESSHWLESSSDDINNDERVGHALHQIYLSPEAAKKKKAIEENIEKQKKEESPATVLVNAPLEEVVDQPCQFEYQQQHQIHPCPSPFDEISSILYPQLLHEEWLDWIDV